MPYVSRNDTGKIVALYNAPVAENDEWLDVQHPDVIEFLSAKPGAEQARLALSASDSDVVRVIEDIIELLIAKKVFIYTELPERAQQKLVLRQKLRKEVTGLSNLVGDDDAIF